MTDESRRPVLARRHVMVAGGVVLSSVLSGCGQRVRSSGRAAKLIAAARAQKKGWTSYDAAYRTLTYPGGDVPPNKGVCADVIVRAYRVAFGIDLQQKVHEDMLNAFDLYPDRWGLKAPDANIDHRRVPNLEVFFSRFAERLPVSDDPADYRPGDIVTTRPITRPHIAIVGDELSWLSGKLKVIQNKGFSVQENDDLIKDRIVGHFRYAL